MTKNNHNNHHPNPAVIEKFLALQEQELMMRGKGLELQRQNDSNAHEYAKAALEANIRDREASRQHEANTIQYRYIFTGIIIIIFMLLVGVALFLNKDQIIMEIIKAILFFGSGGLGGYAYAKKHTGPQ